MTVTSAALYSSASNAVVVVENGDPESAGRDPWGTLGIERGASWADARRAWHLRSQLLHPDRHAGSSDQVRAEAESAMKQLNDAWAALDQVLRPVSPPKPSPDSSSPDGDEVDEEPLRGDDTAVAAAAEDLAGAVLLAAERSGVWLTPTETEALFKPYGNADAGLVVKIADRCHGGMHRLLATDGSDEGWRVVDGAALPTSLAESYERLCDLDDPPIAFVVVEAIVAPADSAD